jgi:hypothetical protein
MRLALLLVCSWLLGGKEAFVVVAGLGGEPDYEQRFAAQAIELGKMLKEAGAADVAVLSGPAATKDKVRAAIQAASVGPNDQFALLVIGHGTFDGEFKLNLPGPDATADEFGQWLGAVPAKRQLVALMTSASGGAIEALQSPGRVVMTATRSGTEKNAPVFARFFVEALRGGAADRDKNEAVSALEAFQFAQTKTKQYYDAAQRLMPEHATLAKESEAAAARIVLTQGEALRALAANPAKQKLLERRDTVEAQIDALKLRKAAMTAEEYRRQMQRLLLDLAKVQQEIDQ